MAKRKPKKAASSAIARLCQRARAASQKIALASTQEKNEALRLMASGLRAHAKEILKANAKDIRAGEAKGLSKAMLDRLLLTAPRVEAMAASLEEVAQLADPVGAVLSTWERPNGLKIQKIRIPIGVLAIIYEARPNVTVEAASLCLKSGNAVILRGGSEAFHSNRALAAVLSQALRQANLPADCIQILPTTDRAAVAELLKQDEWIDLVIPRGGESLIRTVVKHSRIPVIKHYKGVCHLYIDESADPAMAEEILINAKVQRPGVCNAVETLLVHRSLQHSLLPRLVAALRKKGVEVRATKEIIKICPTARLAKAGDFGTEFLDLIIAVKLVDHVEEAIEHIRCFGSAHTESIVTPNPAHAETFLRELQSSVVLHNASTRFADGGELGLGAEIGISTTKLHAFGPMGLADLTIAHFVVRGDGQTRS